MKYIYLFLIIFLPSIVISCTTTDVLVVTIPEHGYDTYYNGRYVCKTPCVIETSNLFWKEHEVVFKKNGIVSKNKLKKEVKWANTCGWVWFYGIGLLFFKGPMKNQVFRIDTVAPSSHLSSKTSTDKMLIAVMEFQAQGVPESIAKNISELIRGELINTQRYVVIERSQMGEILREQGFQQSGCTDISCAVKVGKILSAKKMLIGTVMIMGNKIIISGRIVDVEKGIGEKAANQSADSEEKLDEAVHIFSEKIAGITE